MTRSCRLTPCVRSQLATRLDLADTSWQVTSYNNGREAVVSLIIGSEISLHFGNDGFVSGNAGCNDYAGGLTASNGAITVETPGMTFRFCEEPPGVMEQEREFLAALASATTYSVEGNQLQMRTAEDSLALIATRQVFIDLPVPPTEPEIQPPADPS